MVGNWQSRWVVAGTTFVVWALVAASAAYWGMKLMARPESGPAVAPLARTAAPADPATVARVLGASPAAAQVAPVASLSSRFVLTGVVASASHEGAALIAVDGRPPRPFRVGTEVDPQLVLKAVNRRSATLASADGSPVLTLELPPPKP